MIRLLKCTKDAYLTSKLVKNSNPHYSRSYTSNTGQAGTFDFYKLYNETAYVSGAANTIELTRGLIDFDLSPVRSLYLSGAFNLNSAKFYLSLKDVYGGQSTPTNFKLEVYPLAKTFSEGSGHDVVGYKDVDAANWFTASIDGSTIVPWVSGGCDYGIYYGAAGADYWTSGSLDQVTTSSFSVTQSFVSGDENLFVDVTRVVSASLASIITFNGFRIAFNREQENDTITRFVKRFSTRHSSKFLQHPKIIFSVDTSIADNQINPVFNRLQNFYAYNFYQDNLTNFVSGAVDVTGSNCLKVELVSSKSITYWTSSFSLSHSQSINHLTSTWQTFTKVITGSQYYNGSSFLSGVYHISLSLDFNSAEVRNYLTSSTNLEALLTWKSLDESIYYSKGPTLTFRKEAAEISRGSRLDNVVCNIVNLKGEYALYSKERLKVFLFEYNTFYTPYKLPVESKSITVSDMHWRVINAYTKDVIIDYDYTTNGTKLSSDGSGMYFDFWMEDLEKNQNYEFEFSINNNGSKIFITNQGFVFKIV